MKWTEDKLRTIGGYEIKNAEIKDVDLSMADHGCLTLSLVLDDGGYVLGNGYVGAKDFKVSAAGMESIMRIMDVVGCDSFNDMEGKVVRIATKGWGDSVKIIGNAIEDKWFDIKSFFESVKEKYNE